MKIILVLFPFLAGVLGAIINAGENCHADNCLRAVAGSDPRHDITSRRELCSSWMSATRTYESRNASSTAPAKRVISAGNGTVTAAPEETSAALPRHATVCAGPAAYSSACSCWGVTAFGNAGPTPTGLPSATDIAGPPTADPTLSSTSINSSFRMSTASVLTSSGKMTSGISSGFLTSDPALSSGIFPNVSATTSNTRPTSPSLVLDPTPSGKATITGSIIDGPPMISPTASFVSAFNSTSGISSIRPSSSFSFSNSSGFSVLPTNSGSGFLSSSTTTTPMTSPGTISARPISPSSPSSSRTPFTNTTTSRTFTSSTITPTLFPNSTLISPSPTPTACTGGTCDTYQAWPCSGPLGDCLCGVDPIGASFCFEDNECALEADCASNSDCPTGQRCVVQSCCLASKCVIERKAGTCGNANGARMIFGLDRRGKAGQKKRCGEGRNGGGC